MLYKIRALLQAINTFIDLANILFSKIAAKTGLEHLFIVIKRLVCC